MFNGRSRTTKVDMRGSDQGVSRDVNLKGVREARAQRQKEQKNQRSATKIQSIYRGYRSRQLFWNQLEEAVTSEAAAESSSLALAIRRFFFLKSTVKAKSKIQHLTLVRVFAFDASECGAVARGSLLLARTLVSILIALIRRKISFPPRVPVSCEDEEDITPWKLSSVVERLFALRYGKKDAASVSQIAELLGWVGQLISTGEGTSSTEGVAELLRPDTPRNLSALVWKVIVDQFEDGEKKDGDANVVVPKCLADALLGWNPLLGIAMQKLQGSTNFEEPNGFRSQISSFSEGAPSYTKTLLGGRYSENNSSSNNTGDHQEGGLLAARVELCFKEAVLGSTQTGGLNSLSIILQCEGDLHLHSTQIYQLILGGCSGSGGKVPATEVVTEALSALSFLKEEEEIQALLASPTSNSKKSSTTPTGTTLQKKNLSISALPKLLRLYNKQTVLALFLHALHQCSAHQQSHSETQSSLQKLDEVCGIYIEPWLQFCGQGFYGAQERRRKAFPLLAFFAEQKQLMLALWQILKDLHHHWATNDGSGFLVIKFPKLVLLFLTVFTSTFASGTGDVAQLFGAATAEQLRPGTSAAVAAGGSSSTSGGSDGAACPLPLEDVRALVIMMRDHVFRSHMNGCATDDATKAVAQASYQLLAKLHSVDESLHFLNGTDWCVTDFQYPLLPLTMAQWVEVRGSIIESVAVDGTTSHPTPVVVMPAGGEDGDSESDEEDWAARFMADGRRSNYAQPPRRRVGQPMRTSAKPLKEFDSRSPPYARVGQLLLHCPFVVPFTTRLQLVGGLMISERERQQGVFWAEEDEVKVKRSDLFQDAFEKLGRWSAAKLKGRIPVRFVGEDGEMEAGFGDGVVREFMMEVCRNGFSGTSSLFIEGSNGLYPRPHSQYFLGAEHLNKFTFLGRLVGKALKEGILLDIPFARFFRNALIGRTNGLSEMPSYDAEQYRSLVQLQSLDAATIRDLSLTFSVTVEVLGTQTELPLIAGGKDIEVTFSNLQQYIHLMADFRLNREGKQQAEHFKRGFFEMVDQSWFAVFDSNEVQTLLQGAEDDVGLDLFDWREHTTYGQGYHISHPTIQSFWRVLENCSPAEQRLVLQFVTSVKRAPLLGFRHMTPRFSIIKAGTDNNRLPTAATCMCLLKLPDYPSDVVLREKLLKAAHDGATFELS